jgi:hypothetical protein
VRRDEIAMSARALFGLCCRPITLVAASVSPLNGLGWRNSSDMFAFVAVGQLV